jgi:mannose-6-phosphate isomerase-like protein (cupin superfamily)
MTTTIPIGTASLYLEPIKIVEKVWGRELWLVNEENYCAKILQIKQWYQCSKHYHPIKHETFIVLTGVVFVEVGFENRRMLCGESQVIPTGAPHRFGTNFTGGASILEISTHHDDNDVVRLEESRKITD